MKLWGSIAIGATALAVVAVGCGQVLGIEDWTPGGSGAGGQGGDPASSSKASSSTAGTGGAGVSTGTGGASTSAGPGGSSGQAGSSSTATSSGGASSASGTASSSSMASSGGGGPTACTTTSDCPDQLSCCGNFCVNTANDILNCGACGVECPGDKPFCNGTYCDPTPCEDPSMLCTTIFTCCGPICCGLGELCCVVEGPGPVGGPKCYPPENGTCPIGCPTCL